MIDFTMMYVTHDAFRRDLERLRRAAVAGTAETPQVRAGWENFKRQLLLHHTVEDNHLWPRVQEKVAGRARELALLADMEAEHARLDPVLARMEAALGEPGAEPAPELATLAAELTDVLVSHLDHEEKSALPLIQDVLTADDWRAFAGKMREAQGIKGAAVYVPWIVDGIPQADREHFFEVMPAPVRVLNRMLWERRYRAQDLWGASR
jgi:iron-sulfur cluster repair protein YtfE (RIC family)